MLYEIHYRTKNESVLDFTCDFPVPKKEALQTDVCNAPLVCILVWHIFHDVFYPAIQNAA